MAKSNRRRKLDRAKREARDTQKHVSAQRRQAAESSVAEALAAYARLFDPDLTVSELVSLIGGRYNGGPISLFLTDEMAAAGSSPERLAEISAAMLAAGSQDDSGPSLTALTFAAEVARAAGDSGRARELLEQAVTVADDPYDQVHLTNYLRASGRLADAILLLEACLRDEPDDDYAVELYGVAMQEAYEHAHLESPFEGCPCGQGTRWPECCGPREQAALDRFADRTAMQELADAIIAFLVRTPFGGAVASEADDIAEAYDDLEWTAAEDEAFRALISEHALLTARPRADGPADDDDEDETLLPLGAFAADPSVPSVLAARAEAWRTHIHYGLWRIDSRSAAPGLWCTDICTGVVRYAEFPAHLAGPWPRWSVWLAALVPVDGVWRATGAGLQLSPTEADAAADLLQDAIAHLVSELAGKKKRPARRPVEPMRFGRAEPHGVAVDGQDQVERDLAHLISVVVGSLLSRIVGEIQLHRSSSAAVRNIDADELRLISAEVSVHDSEQVANRLAARPGFERDADDPALFTWYGLRIPDDQRAGMRGRGIADADIDDPLEPKRSVRGTLEVSPGQILVLVNSAERLARLLDVLTKIGANPVVTKQTQIDALQDLARPGGEHARPRGTASGDGWEKQWLDEQLPALRGRTPRQAVSGKDWALVETLLRQFEYENDLLTAQGQLGIDTYWMRQELDLTSEEE
jgi:tetratricopeptide (TPR) repeat protein